MILSLKSGRSNGRDDKSPLLKKARFQPFEIKVMLIFFGDQHSAVLMVFLAKGTRIKGKYASRL